MLEQISVSKPLISLHVFQMEMFNLENKISFKKNQIILTEMQLLSVYLFFFIFLHFYSTAN